MSESESDYGQDRCWKVPVYVCMFEWIEYSWITLLVNTMFSVVSYSFENIGIYDYRYHASQKCTLITKHSIDHDTPITVNSVKYYWHSSLEAWITETQVSCTRHLGASESVEAGLGGQIGCSNGGTVQNVTGADMSSLTPEEYSSTAICLSTNQ